MGILDKLLEKKDLYAYINFRSQELVFEMYKAVKEAKPKEREFIKRKFQGRIAELKYLNKNVMNIKRASIETSKRVYDEINRQEAIASCGTCSHCGCSMEEHDDPDFCPPGTEEAGGRR